MAIKVEVAEDRQVGLTRRTLSVLNNGVLLCPDVFFECSGIALPQLKSLDFAALATVFVAMRTGNDLHIGGPVSRRLLRHLEEFQEAWAIWQPHLYRPVRITADTEIDGTECARDRRAVFAFSGGVDSVFSLIRHNFKLAGRRSCSPVAACLVHGFDIPLDQQRAFSVAQQAAQLALAPLQVPLAIVKTNWVSQLCGSWTNEFGAALAACLHQFSGLADTGIIGADEDYSHLRLPWGSNVATNHLLSGSEFEIVTDGAGFTRSKKVELISNYRDLAATLRVCWEGESTGRNCGRCEKCVRTKMNFMAFGKEPVCFADGRPTPWQIITINAHGGVQRDYLREIYSTAKANGINEPWIYWLATGIAGSYASAGFRQLKKLVQRR